MQFWHSNTIKSIIVVISIKKPGSLTIYIVPLEKYVIAGTEREPYFTDNNILKTL